MIKYPNITVLYVDDEKDNLFVFKANFSRKFKIITTISPIEALEELDDNHDDIIVVISDMRMPLMNGIDFIKKAKAKYTNISYFILTGFGYNEEIETALNSKVITDCFTKPFDAGIIEDAILTAAKSLNRLN